MLRKTFLKTPPLRVRASFLFRPMDLTPLGIFYGVFVHSPDHKGFACKEPPIVVDTDQRPMVLIEELGVGSLIRVRAECVGASHFGLDAVQVIEFVSPDLLF